MKRKTLTLITIICGLFAAGIIGSILIYTHQSGAKIAYIYQNGECIQTIDLNQVSESYTFTVEGADGAYNEIEVRPGEIAVISASCPDKVCVHAGFIQNDLLPISCIPNRLVIHIGNGNSSATGNTDGLDAIVR